MLSIDILDNSIIFIHILQYSYNLYQKVEKFSTLSTRFLFKNFITKKENGEKLRVLVKYPKRGVSFLPSVLIDRAGKIYHNMK